MRFFPPGAPLSAFTRGFGGTCFLLGVVLFVGCAGEQAPARTTFLFDGPIMGTSYKVKIVRGELADPEREALANAIRAELEDVNARMSTYINDSELMLLNAHETSEPFPLSAGTYEVLEKARTIYDETGGAFDVTIGPLVGAWGFGVDAEDPEAVDDLDTRIADAVERVGFEKLTLADGAVTKSRPDVFSDLSAIAKGYAVDRVSEKLEEMGETDFMAEVGGEVRAAGTNAEGNAWRIGIERPEVVQGALQRIVPLANMAMATSGDYRNYREVNGKRVAHIMDPRTRRPIEHRLASVSVVDETCTLADAYATALFVLGSEEGYKFATEKDLAAFFLVRDGEGYTELATPAFETLGKAQ